jgi:hypothetical protein
MQPQSKKVGAKSAARKKTNPPRASAAAAQDSAQTDSSRNKPQAAESAASAAPPQDLQAAIALRAYELYQKRGGQGGNELEDWLEAERQVLAGRTAGIDRQDFD